MVYFIVNLDRFERNQKKERILVKNKSARKNRIVRFECENRRGWYYSWAAKLSGAQSDVCEAWIGTTDKLLTRFFNRFRSIRQENRPLESRGEGMEGGESDMLRLQV
jgi:hypothetical protein